MRISRFDPFQSTRSPSRPSALPVSLNRATKKWKSPSWLRGCSGSLPTGPSVPRVSSPIKHQARSIQMSAPNGRANGSAIDNPSELVVPTAVRPGTMNPSNGPQFSTDQIKELIAELEVPFDPAAIEWRVTNTTKSGKLRGQVIPYADPRAYTARLTSLFTPAGW